MTSGDWVDDLKLASVGAIGTAMVLLALQGSPAYGADIMFSSANPAAKGTSVPSGDQRVASGTVQLRLDDGTTVSIVGPATYSVDAGGQLSVLDGAFTAIAPPTGTAMPIVTGSGTVALNPGSSVNGKVDAAGSFTGFAVNGTVSVASNGKAQSFSAGSAFQGSATGGVGRIATAGVQPNGGSVFGRFLQAQQKAGQYLANPGLTSPTGVGTSGVALNQNPAPGTPQSAWTPARVIGLSSATGTVDAAYFTRFVTDLLASLAQDGTVGDLGGLSALQVQLLLDQIARGGVPGGIDADDLIAFYRALGDAGFRVGGANGGPGASFGSIADLFALIASGGTIPPGDPTVQALLDMLTVLPPGIDVDMLRQALLQGGYTLPDALANNGSGGPGNPGNPGNPGMPVLIGSGDGVQPADDGGDLTLSYTTVSGDGIYQNLFILRDDDGQFSGYRTSTGFVVDLTGEDMFGNDRYVAEYGGDAGIVGLARIAGGSGALAMNRGANGGDHYVWGLPLTNRPMSGTLSYDLIAATSPTIRDSSVAPGTFSGSLAVAFGPADIFYGLDATVAIGGDTYAIESPGGLASPSLRVNPDGRFSSQTIDIADQGSACNVGNCRVEGHGFLAGNGGSHAGWSYTIRDDRSNNVAKWVDGAAIFGADGAQGGNNGGGNGGAVSGTTRQDQYVAYAAGQNIGIDSRTPGPNRTPPLPLNVTYSDNGGAPLGYEWTTNESPTIGTASEHESGSLGDVIGWTRWAEGTLSGNFYNGPAKTYGANEGFHIVAGTPVTNIPTQGTVSYALAGATAPTIRDGSLAPGSFTGDLAIAFGATPMAGFDFDVSIGGSSYGFGTAGGAANPANGGRPIETSGDFAWTFFANNLDVSGLGSCSSGGGCASMRGFLAGDGASAVGVSYTFGGGGLAANVDGAAAFGTPVAQ